MEEFRKLKRGLKDVSPLFEGEPSAASPAPAPVSTPGRPAVFNFPGFGSDLLQVMSIFHPLKAHAAGSLCEALALKAQSLGKACTVITVDPLSSGVQTQRQCVKHLSLSASDFDAAFSKADCLKLWASEKSSVLLLDYAGTYPLQMPAALSVLDKWIFWSDSKMENLADIYRMMKAGTSWNQKMEYFFMYDGPAGDAAGSRLYERLSEMVSRRLGASLYWLGSCPSSQAAGEIGCQALNIEGLFIKNNPLNLNEKKALQDFIGTKFS